MKVKKNVAMITGGMIASMAAGVAVGMMYEKNKCKCDVVIDEV